MNDSESEYHIINDEDTSETYEKLNNIPVPHPLPNGMRSTNNIPVPPPLPNTRQYPTIYIDGKEIKRNTMPRPVVIEMEYTQRIKRKGTDSIINSSHKYCGYMVDYMINICRSYIDYCDEYNRAYLGDLYKDQDE
jgi:hypothetical protein